MVVLGRSVLENRMKLTKKERVRMVARALLGDIVPPPMTSPSGLASYDVWITLESGEAFKGYFHSNGYCYTSRPVGIISRWKRDATVNGGATAEWRDERPCVVSWSNDPPLEVSPKGSRARHRQRQQTSRPRLLAHPPAIPALPGSPSRKAPRAPRAAKRG